MLACKLPFGLIVLLTNSSYCEYFRGFKMKAVYCGTSIIDRKIFLLFKRHLLTLYFSCFIPSAPLFRHLRIKYLLDNNHTATTIRSRRRRRRFGSKKNCCNKVKIVCVIKRAGAHINISVSSNQRKLYWSHNTHTHTTKNEHKKIYSTCSSAQTNIVINLIKFHQKGIFQCYDGGFVAHTTHHQQFM